MTKVYTSAVAIIPPEDKWQPIQAIRKKYDKHVDRWMPHINLLYPFRPEDEFESIELKFKETCNIIKPFIIHLNEFKFFSHRYNNFTIWLAPEPAEKVKELQLELLKLVPECNDVNRFKKGFTPHLSVGQVVGRTNLNKLLSELKKSWKTCSFKVNKVYFISRENKKSSQFKVKKTITLGTSNNNNS